MTATLALTLDTQPPRLLVEAADRVSPPDPLLVTVIASEPLGIASAALEDSLGSLRNLGVERLDAKTLRVLVPTVDVAQGPATLRLSVSDEVLNFTREARVVQIDRPLAFDVSLSITGAYEEVLNVGSAYEILLTEGSAYDVAEMIDYGYSVTFGLTPAYQIALEVT